LVAPVAAIEVATAIAGTVMTRILSNQGDVSWELDQLQGIKSPGANPSDVGPSEYANQIVNVPGPRLALGGGLDEIYADFELTFQYNGQSLGNITITPVHANDALGAGLTVKASISNDANTYAKPPETKRFAAIKVQFHYRFTNAIYSDSIAITNYTLYGDGTFDERFRWTQD
jgi:hypothetical protein